MKILAFETSCDDTSIALFEDDKLIAMETASQIKIHNETSWVVPEIAAREHANNIFKVLDKVLKNINRNAINCVSTKHWKNSQNPWETKKDSEIILNFIDYIAVTTNPWLVPSLLTWITVAKTISRVLNIPLIEINHIEAHIFSNYLERKKEDINYPLVCLTVSGGHNEIYLMKNMFDFTKVGWTLDDSAWEAFDKVAKMMDLWYPWGPIISKLAEDYINKLTKNKKFITSLQKNLFPRSFLDKNELNFSFSGIKTNVKYFIDKKIKENTKLTKLDKQEISFEFQEAVTEVLAKKLVFAAEKYKVKTIMLAGWVSANSRLKEYIKELIIWKDLKFIFPVKNLYSMDNAAMVWINAYYKILQQKN